MSSVALQDVAGTSPVRAVLCTMLRADPDYWMDAFKESSGDQYSAIAAFQE